VGITAEQADTMKSYICTRCTEVGLAAGGFTESAVRAASPAPGLSVRTPSELLAQDSTITGNTPSENGGTGSPSAFGDR
jgi:hypothetical protein